MQGVLTEGGPLPTDDDLHALGGNLLFLLHQFVQLLAQLAHLYAYGYVVARPMHWHTFCDRQDIDETFSLVVWLCVLPYES